MMTGKNNNRNENFTAHHFQSNIHVSYVFILIRNFKCPKMANN